MTFVLLILVSSTSMTGSVRAECVPLPDCASIGYTATSCDGDSIKCPFDTSKLFCIPCDTKYKYTCLGDNITGGTGSSCGGKYVSCTCSSGEWDSTSGTCKSTQNCLVGYIYYSDKTCSADYDSSKTVAGIVVKANELVMSEPTEMIWSSSYTNTSLKDMSQSEAKADKNGKSNTAVIVSAHPDESASNNAAIYCNTYTGGVAGTSGEWYLPAAGELYSYVYGNYNTINPVVRTLSWTYFDAYFWSSSEYTNYDAWSVYSAGGGVYGGSKDGPCSVSCFLEID